MPYTPNTGSSQSGMHYRPMGKQQKQIRALFPPDYPTMAPKLGAAIGAAAGGDQNNSHGFWKPTTPRAPSFFMKVLRHPWVSAIPYVLVTTGVVALEMVFIYMYGLPPWIAAISTVITVSMTIGVGLVLSWAAFKGNDTENAQIANIDALNGSVQRLLVLTLSSATTAGVTNPETAKKFAKIRRLMLAFLFGLKHEFRDNDHFQVSEVSRWSCYALFLFGCVCADLSNPKYANHRGTNGHIGQNAQRRRQEAARANESKNKAVCALSNDPHLHH